MDLSDTPPSAPKNNDSDLSLPELLKQIAVLTATTDAQLASLITLAQPSLGVPATASASSDKESDDLPTLLKRLQEKVTKEVAEIGSFVKAFGGTVPVGADVDGALGALLSLPGVPAPPAAPVVSAGSAQAEDLPSMLKQLVDQQTAQQRDLDQAFSANGIDPAAPEKFFAGASSSPAPLSGEPLSGFPGAEKVASLPSDMLRLMELQNKVMSLMIPR